LEKIARLLPLELENIDFFWNVTLVR